MIGFTQKIRYMYKKLTNFFMILYKRFDEKKLTNVIQFIYFAIIGVSNTVIHYGIYLVSILMGLNYILANFIGFTVGVINSFYWNSRYVFRNDRKIKHFCLLTLIKTYISYGLTGILLNSILLHIEIDILEINRLIAPLVNALITIPLNFVINKYWAYKVKS